MTFNKPSFVIFTLLATTALTACHKTPSYQQLEGETMGTSYHIRYELPKEADQTAIKASIDKRLDEVNNSMSTWQEDSTISQFNLAAVNTPVKIDADFAHVLKDSQKVYAQSGGALDPTVKPVFELWGFGKEMRVDRLQSPPSAAEVEQAKSLIGFDSIRLNGNELSKTKEGVAIDFSAIAKGYGVDVIADVLESKYKIKNYMVEIGGEVATSGVNDKNAGWKIAIDAPILHSGVANREVIAAIVQPVDDSKNGKMNLATSGNYRNSIVFDGVRYSHTIDPHTGNPIVDGAPSVTVAANTVAMADAWATALTAMPYQQALQTANKQNLAVMFVVPKTGVDVNQAQHKLEDWQIVETEAMQKLRNRAQP